MGFLEIRRKDTVKNSFGSIYSILMNKEFLLATKNTIMQKIHKSF